MLDYSKYQTTQAIPEASSMIESFRAIGYSLETAIADLIDNSISAEAGNVWINFEWKGSETWLSIRDDGIGMNDSELIQAMRPGSKNPSERRKPSDLGRFGLGLKTASFSQCRKLSVISKKNSTIAYWTWDLDFVKQTGKWDLIKYLPNQTFFESQINKSDSGTVVVWSDIDRLVKDIRADDNKSLDKFLIALEHAKQHLAMIFHRFIESGKLKIHLQDRPIKAWNPFLPRESCTQIFPSETYHDGKVNIKGYVLPHQSKLNSDTFREAGGVRGWNEHQGFYIYRNDRLLLAGDWLGLARKEEHYKLARIEVNLPNELDSQWQIDIRKSIARPPLYLRDQLKAYANKIRTYAVEVYRHRGRKAVSVLPGQPYVPLWIDFKKDNKWFHKVNRKHPLVTNTKVLATSDPDKAIEILLRFIEETIPVKSIYIKEAEQSEILAKPCEGIDYEEVHSLIRDIYLALITEGKSRDEAVGIIFNLEPFNLFPECINSLD